MPNPLSPPVAYGKLVDSEGGVMMYGYGLGTPAAGAATGAMTGAAFGAPVAGAAAGAMGGAAAGFGAAPMAGAGYGYGAPMAGCGPVAAPVHGGGRGFALIIVLFILLVIIGASWTAAV